MLVSFSVSHFRSIGEEITLNMVASNHYSDHPAHVMPLPGVDRSVVRTAVIYGANGAGKSNLVKAIARAQDIILGRWHHPGGVEAYAFVPDAKTIPSSFEFRFVAAGRIFAYGFDMCGRSVRAEWLALVSKGDDVPLFDRDAEGHTTIHDAAARKRFGDDPQFHDLLKSLAGTDLNDTQLFLNRASEVRESKLGPTMQAVIEWFAKTLVVVPIDSAPEHTLGRLCRDPALAAFAGALLDGVGTGIHKLEIVERETPIPSGMRDSFDDVARFSASNPDTTMLFSRDPQSPDRCIARTLMACHERDGAEYQLPMSEESDGSRRLLSLASLLTSGVPQPRVFVVDELDRSLHPTLCWRFLELFADSVAAARRQLIVTTHEAHLLDQDLLRRDEYWFMEKDETQQSRLVPLSAYRDVRKDLQLEKGYLSGRFGAVPFIGPVEQFRQLLAPFTEEAAADAAEATPA
jgi:ABC-type cobalamin/Fe3+-siderophores transport system ATPase subunit